MSTPRKSRRAFTLVELLVVIGIIAVLVGILLPTLSKARASAYKIKCGSQLRTIGQFAAMYAATYRNFVPLGWISQGSLSPGSSIIWEMQKSNKINGPVGLGYIFAARIAKSDGAATQASWYCPSIWQDWRFSLDRFTNKWAPMPLSDAEAQAWGFGSSIELKMGYSSRIAMSSSSADDTSLKWTAVAATGPTWSPPTYTGTAFNRSIKTFSSKAIVSDLLGDPRLVDGVHKNGVQVLYGHWGVKWVPIEMFKQDLLLTKVNPSPAENYLDASPDKHALARIWETFDRQ